MTLAADVALASLLLAVLAALAGAAQAKPAADLVVTNARVWTVDSRRPEAEALAVIGERIVDVGSATEIERWHGAETQVIDAAGRRVVPGFNDAHVHFVDGGAQLENVDLKDADSPEEFARRIGERARARPGEWILGGDWDDQRWTPPELPTRALIDDVTNGTPVFVNRYDGHMALANSAALGRAGITQATPDPPAARSSATRTAIPTGVLKDAAMDLVQRVIPKTTVERRLQRGQERAGARGVARRHERAGHEPVLRRHLGLRRPARTAAS